MVEIEHATFFLLRPKTTYAAWALSITLVISIDILYIQAGRDNKTQTYPHTKKTTTKPASNGSGAGLGGAGPHSYPI